MPKKPEPGKDDKPDKPMTAREALLFEKGWMDFDMLVAAMGISKRTAYRWRVNGLPFSKPGNKLFFQKEHVDAWLMAQMVVVKQPKGKKNLQIVCHFKYMNVW